MSDSYQIGTVRRLFYKRWYGYISAEGPDIFVHGSDLVGFDFLALREGAQVRYTVGQDPQGRPIAENVQVIAPAPGSTDLETRSGFIIKLDQAGHWGFIREPGRPKPMFFHGSGCLDDFKDLREGMTVSYLVDVDPRERQRAIAVVVE